MDLVTLVRRHLSGAIGLLLALATGIALGAGPLSKESLLPTTAAPAPAAQAAAGPDGDEVAAAAAPGLYGTRLEGRTVALLSTPGVDSATLDALTTGIEAADGSVTGRWTAGESLVGPGEKTLVDTLGSQLLDQLEGRGADEDAAAYERMGQLLGTAIATREPAGLVPGPDALTVRQSLDAASLLGLDGRATPRRAPLVLVVLGDDLDDYVVRDLVSGLASRASGVVVTGPEEAADLDVLAESGEVTTVDGVGGDLGQLAAVLALARVEKAPGRSFGASGSDALLPLG
jgi:hypothetical protein